MNNQPKRDGANRQAGGFGPGRRGPGGPHGAMMTREKPKNMKKTVVKLIKYIGSSKYLVVGLLFVMIFTTLLNLAGPVLQQKAIDALSVDFGSGKVGVDFGTLGTVLVLMALTYGMSSLLTYLQNIYAAKLSQSTVYVMRKDLFKKISYLPIKFTDTHQHGDLMSRMTNDVENISQTISQSIGSLFSGVITIVGTLFIMLWYSPLLTLVSMVTIPLTIFVSMYMSKFMRKYFKAQQEILGELNGEVEEMVSGYKTVIAFGREKTAVRDFTDISTRMRRVGIKANIFGGVMGPLMNVIGNIGYLCVAAAGGYLAIKTYGTPGAISIGIIQAFIQLSKQFTRPINEIANQYASIQTAVAGAERVFEIMDSPSEIDEGTYDITENGVVGALEFNNLEFSYVEGELVLRDFNLKVKPGQKIAIVGKTGAGKTTVANLLTRFYEIDGGEILLDGRNITEITKKSLRRNIAIVLQDTVLFSDTIENNILYGNESASHEDVVKAAATANADAFVERLPDGYSTELAESGSNLSQGQRQLLAIARAVLADPKILILDEATSSVDTRTEMHIQEAMIELMKGRTSLIIAHRLSTIKDADMIIVVADGKVAESGSHDELLAKKGFYYDLYKTQYAGFAT